MPITLTEREQEAILYICDIALKAAGNNALQAVVVVHQALSRGQQVQSARHDVQAADAN